MPDALHRSGEPRDEFTVIFTKAGYHSVEIPVRTQVAGAGAAGVVGNVGARRAGSASASMSRPARRLNNSPNPVVATLTPLRKGEQPGSSRSIRNRRSRSRARPYVPETN